MADVTTPFGFPYPESTDLVRDGATDIEALAEGVNDQFSAGFQFAGQRIYTSSGQFVKADPLGTGDIGLRAIRVRVQGAGGGGAGAGSTGAGVVAINAHGGGGAFCESFITNIAGLDATVTVTRGGGGAGGVGASGSAGGSSSFGSLVVAGGGNAGLLLGNGAAPSVGERTAGTSANTGELIVAGQPSDAPIYVANNLGGANTGANSFLGRGGNTVRTSSGANGGAGFQGGGGSAAAQTQSQASTKTGGTGGNGIVIVEVFV